MHRRTANPKCTALHICMHLKKITGCGGWPDDKQLDWLDDQNNAERQMQSAKSWRGGWGIPREGRRARGGGKGEVLCNCSRQLTPNCRHSSSQWGLYWIWHQELPPATATAEFIANGLACCSLLEGLFSKETRLYDKMLRPYFQSCSNRDNFIIVKLSTDYNTDALYIFSKVSRLSN